MLDIELFQSATEPGEGLTYYGANRYNVTYNDRYHHFTISVRRLDEDGEPIPGTQTEEYAASALSSAIATIEQIENGEEI